MRRLLVFCAIVLACSSFTILAQSPPPLVVDLTTGSQVRLSWTSTPGSFVLEETETLGTWRPFLQIPTLLNGQFSITVEITGYMRFFRLRRVQTGGLPPDPASVAPPVPGGVATQLAGATEFLYTGPNPIQTGVAPGTIEARRAAVVRGTVRKRDNTPLPGVTISILNHPELGQTLSRADGMFDLAVNGGGLLTVNYGKSGFCRAQRQLNVPWQDYVMAQDVVLIGMDPIVTPVTLGINSPMQVAQGSMQTDADGTRCATLLFMPGTCGSLVLPDGTVQECGSISVRATEFTVGTNGPNAMPGELPPSSGYTYCVELSADEATAAGAQGVRFTSPVVFYVENFIGFPVGSLVPAGFYDRGNGQWLASDNGRVIKVISITGGSADLDLDGNGTIDDATALAAFGITDGERHRLASLYTAGQELWRVLIPHFTPWDCNWPYGPPPGAEPPGGGGGGGGEGPKPGPKPDKPLKHGPNKECGSIIGSESQTLGELVNVTGTPLSLHYQSGRMPGRRATNVVKIRLSGSTLPPGLQRIHLEIAVAGQAFKKNFVPQPNLFDSFTWDGKDAYGRAVQGQQPVKVRIGYQYIAQYYSTPDSFAASFNRFGSPPNSVGRAGGGGGGGGGGGAVVFSAVPARTTTPPIVLWQDYEASLGGRLDSLALGGWCVSVHHTYDVWSRTLYLGNGDERSATSVVDAVITAVAGTGVSGFAGDGGLATEARLSRPQGLAVGSDGTLYVSDTSNHRIRHVRPDGIINTIAGTGNFGSTGDGGPAIQAELRGPQGIAVGSDGTLYIADTGNNRIRRVGANGIITTVAGTGVSGFAGDGGPAAQAQMSSPEGVAIGPDGSLFIADKSNHRIRRVASDGIITTVAGTGTFGLIGDGGPATEASILSPEGVAVASDGSLYIADPNRNLIRHVAPDGIITTVAGGGSFSGDGQPATKSQLNLPTGVAVGSNGSLYVADFGSSRVRRMGPDRILTTVAGTGNSGITGDGGPARQAELRLPDAVAVAPGGDLYILDRSYDRIRKLGPSLPGFSLSDVLIAAEDGSELYVFTSNGRHERTIDSLTGALRLQFSYNSDDRLASIIDGDGNVTVIERDGGGNPLAIVAPFGQRTSLTVQGDGYLSSVTNPAGEAVHLTYNSGAAKGLLATLTDPRGNLHRYFYDAFGRLVRDENPAGGVATLARTDLTDDHYAVSLTTALGLVTTYEVEGLTTGDTRRVRIDASGARTESLFRTDGSRRVTYPDGSVATLVEGPDPRFGMQAPIVKSHTFITPGGITASRSATRTATLSNPNNLLSLNGQTDTVQINGRTYTRVYDAAVRTFTLTSPAGRQHLLTLDAKGRPIQGRVSGLTPVQLDYGSLGRIASVTQGDRAATFIYNTQGFLSRLTDPVAHTVDFAYDAAGRDTQITRPDGEQVQFAYDGNGNMVSLTPPGRSAHTFAFTPVNLLQTYQPPTIPGASTNLQCTYNVDRRLTQMVRGDTVVTRACDPAGRLQSITSPQETVQATYDASSLISTLTTASSVGLTYTKDGSLLTGTNWSGAVTGTVQRTFDNNRRLIGRTINGAHNQVFTYDADGLLTQAGALTLQRNAANGLLTGSALGLVSDTRSFNGFAEWTSYSATAGATALFSTQYTRDQAGRVTLLVETIAGATATFAYSYDLVGRLSEVQKNGAATSTYTYDANGNRLTRTSGGVATIAGYDAQDRLTHDGAVTFTYTGNGDLLSATAGGQTTSYGYDVVGNLRSVTLPGGTQIEYLIDGRDRRIGKKVNGTNVQGFLYQSRLKPIAELDGNNLVISTFVYGTRPNIPDYMFKGGATYRIIADHLGSPRLVVDTATGAIVQQLDYDESGTVRLDTNPGFQPFGFAGGLYDRDTGLVRFGARDYDPAAGRWTSKDPSGFAGGLNLYVYADADPVNYLDLNGRSALAAAATALAGATGGGTILGLGATSAFVARAAIIGGPTAIAILIAAVFIDSGQADATADDEGAKEGGAPPQDGEADAGSCPLTPVIPQGKTDEAPPPDEAIPDDFLTNPTFPKPGPTPRIPYPETPEDGFDDPSLENPFRL